MAVPKPIEKKTVSKDKTEENFKAWEEIFQAIEPGKIFTYRKEDNEFNSLLNEVYPISLRDHYEEPILILYSETLKEYFAFCETNKDSEGAYAVSDIHEGDDEFFLNNNMQFVDMCSWKEMRDRIIQEIESLRPEIPDSNSL